MPYDLMQLKIKPFKGPSDWYISDIIFKDKDKKNIFQHIPSDYKDFMRKYGEGIIDDFIRIFPPHRVIALTNRWREIGFPAKLQLQFPKIAPKGFSEGAILLGDADTGDQIMFFKGYYYIFCFNAQFEKLFKIDGLNGVFEFYRTGKYWEKTPLKTFTPFDSGFVLDGLNYIEGTSAKFNPYKTDDNGEPVYPIS